MTAELQKDLNDTFKAKTGAIPTGGTTGQALVKTSNTNYSTEWSTITAGISQATADGRYFQLTNNLSDGTAATMRTNLGLGTAATTAATDYATSTQGATADAAVPKSLYDAGTFLYATSDNTPAAKTLAEVRDLLDADDRRVMSRHFGSFQTISGTEAYSSAGAYLAIAASGYAEWSETFVKGTWRFSLIQQTTNANASSTVQLSIGGANLGTAVSTYEASGRYFRFTVDTDKVISTRTAAAVRWTVSSHTSCRFVSWHAWRVD